MSKTPREEFLNYVIGLGEHINTLYDRVKEIELRVDAMTEEITRIRNYAVLGEDLKLPEISREPEERVLSVIENPFTKKRSAK